MQQLDQAPLFLKFYPSGEIDVGRVGRLISEDQSSHLAASSSRNRYLIFIRLVFLELDAKTYQAPLFENFLKWVKTSCHTHHEHMIGGYTDPLAQTEGSHD